MEWVCTEDLCNCACDSRVTFWGVLLYDCGVPRVGMVGMVGT